MKSKNNVVPGLTALKRVFCLVSILAVFLLASLAALPAMAKQTTSSVFAEFTGIFWIVGVPGESEIFGVEESGVSTESTLGAFSYTASVRYDEARIPPGCGPGSSTGVTGKAVLTFPDGSGQLKLRLKSGTACFYPEDDPPTVIVEEQWVIASGTGNERGASGKLSRQFVGVVGPFTAIGTFSGTIKIKE